MVFFKSPYTSSASFWESIELIRNNAIFTGYPGIRRYNLDNGHWESSDFASILGWSDLSGKIRVCAPSPNDERERGKSSKGDKASKGGEIEALPPGLLTFLGKIVQSSSLSLGFRLYTHTSIYFILFFLSRSRWKFSLFHCEELIVTASLLKVISWPMWAIKAYLYRNIASKETVSNHTQLSETIELTARQKAKKDKRFIVIVITLRPLLYSFNFMVLLSRPIAIT